MIDDRTSKTEDMNNTRRNTSLRKVHDTGIHSDSIQGIN